MNQNFLKLIQSGNTAEVASAIAEDPALAVWRDPQDVSALLWSVYCGQPLVRDFLVAKRTAWNLPLDVFEAAATGNEQRLQAILSESPTAALVVSGDGWTPLHLAAAFGTPLGVAALIFRGAAVDAVSDNAQRNQPLHAALALGKNPSAIELLISHGADVNATQAGGFTPIFAAATANRRDLAELLVNHGANPRYANNEGKTPGDFARERGHEELAAWLDGTTE
ncbi:MAG: ankyrin repeat domain-containing protein [Terracidiphilus sp.]